MLFTIFILIICVEIFLTFKFSKMARLVVMRSNDIGVDLFGRKYRSVYEMYMDFNFLNSLFDGKEIHSIEDPGLSEDLVLMRKVLMGQVVGGLLFFLFGMALGLLS